MSMSETPFRVYMIDGDGDPVCIARCDEFSLGDALLDLHKHGRSSVVRGIMYRPVDDEPGEWLLNPWDAVSTTVRRPSSASGILPSAMKDDREEDE